MTEPAAENWPQSVRRLHALYCQWTGQHLSLRFDRERLWYEFLQAGFTPADLRCVVAYLQKQIRAERRNVGALKLSNLLQLDRFEEDLNISRVRLRPPAERPRPPAPPTPPAIPDDQPCRELVEQLKQFRQQLRRGSSAD